MTLVARLRARKPVPPQDQIDGPLLPRFDERHLRARCPGSGAKAGIGAVAFIHRFGSSLNEHTHFHVCVIDGVFEPDSELGVRFIEGEGLDADDAEAVQTQVRRRILRAFVRRGLLEKEDRKEMEQWDHGGGFSLDATVRIEAHDRQGLERLLLSGAHPPATSGPCCWPASTRRSL